MPDTSEGAVTPRRVATTISSLETETASIIENAHERMEHARSVNEKIERAKSETATYVADTERHVQAIRTAASEEAIALTENAMETARATREEAELHASEVRRAADADAVALRHDAREQIAQAKIAIREAEDRVIVAAKEQAETIEADAEIAAGNTITEAREQASMMLDDATQLLETKIAALTEQRNELGRSIEGQRSVLLGQREALTSAIEEMQHVLDDTLGESVVIGLSFDAPSGPQDELVAGMLGNAL